MRLLATSLLLLALCQVAVHGQNEDPDVPDGNGEMDMAMTGEDGVPEAPNAAVTAPGEALSSPAPLMQPNRTGSRADAVKRGSGSAAGSKSIGLPHTAGSDDDDEVIVTKKPSSGGISPSRSTNASSPTPTATQKSDAAGVSPVGVSTVVTAATAAAFIQIWRE
ncbi:hypothetical protein P43SY_003652 [Pythium insidiosum]|uniref:Uncharacterized protein n=1 Tax=Pythium insidiosum TaxID=114742 RepID=A0AAD5M731_PYTIN|nr:hypothetical protein P43SY_003652 [Pythium insidiosum]